MVDQQEDLQMMKRLLPLAMLAGFAGIAGYCVGVVIDVITRVVLRIADSEPVKFDAELEHAKQGNTCRAVEKPQPMPYGTAQARDFVTMLRWIGSRSSGAALA